MRFVGKLTNEKKLSELIKSNYMLHLSSFDGQPMTIIETMALGIPSISTKVGAIPEMLENGCGFLVENDENVIDILINILENSINYDEISIKVREKYLKEYTIEKMVQKICNLIKS